ncbi:MFS transporter [Paenibacillus apiarius]|uniref:MFS transporter n=1 Tax=Paenibacillus apiarius TaxID=46240 RepID=A0ABT4DWV7_9BACL|nr:MFS transporter [Paenibacillus apiarius]MBN3522846.1 MFS transporter [Paenibacillus apiarius]MCY9515391.1 MFS transporter [Paenibacillus apiarius]MCY9521847.1 MFS transporter [Paenibacillus apiarius]MCY9550240.1 MFS transporter [Paenibacillus apiarius]MCY9559516.1 MFS transporter [Paenibacillus apiarius]
MQQWKVNLIILWFGSFLAMAGMTMVTPFLALYLQHDIGMSNQHEIAVWSGLIFAANFLTSFIFQPIWGKFADKYGRKIMILRSGFGMAAVTALMGLAQTPMHLLLLRMLNGTISGFNPAAVALVSSTTPKERMGFAMGILQSGVVAGTILGPLIGGVLADMVGYRPIFYITGTLLFLATMLTMIMVKEPFDREKAAETPQMSVMAGFKQLAGIPQLLALFAVTFLLQFAMMSPASLLPLYVQELHGSQQNLALLAGFVSAVAGMSNMICSPILGRLSDRIGSHRILTVCLIGAACTLIPQAFVSKVWQLVAIRFLLGMFMGGLLPSVNALIRKYTPDGMESRAYSFNSSTLALGNMIGPVMGGAVSGFIGIQGIFIMSGVFLLINTAWARFSLYGRNRAAHRP